MYPTRLLISSRLRCERVCKSDGLPKKQVRGIERSASVVLFSEKECVAVPDFLGCGCQMFNYLLRSSGQFSRYLNLAVVRCR